MDNVYAGTVERIVDCIDYWVVILVGGATRGYPVWRSEIDRTQLVELTGSEVQITYRAAGQVDNRNGSYRTLHRGYGSLKRTN